jgi:hypothetical protein
VGVVVDRLLHDDYEEGRGFSRTGCCQGRAEGEGWVGLE